ncbi:MAG: MarR family winged helix-turn-helix transcriptional regulator [Actinomycetota bacterium]|nr:MarR family winged helix-turn-helix transcriptional regulator [Actinomycetota bacterium]
MPNPVVPPSLPPEFGVYFALLEVSALVQRGVEGQLRRDGGLSFVQFQILAVCGEDPSSPRSMSELADRLVHSKSGVTYQVDRLEQAGLVVRVPSEHDERGVNVTLSPKGTALLARVLPGHVDVVRDVLVRALDGAERDELTRLLGRVAGHLRSRLGRPGRGAGVGEGEA